MKYTVTIRHDGLEDRVAEHELPEENIKVGAAVPMFRGREPREGDLPNERYLETFEGTIESVGGANVVVRVPA
jgi:hypothetical protein